jgi:hypothetical protein
MADTFDIPLFDTAQPSYDTSYLYTPTSAQPGGADFVQPAGYQAPVDTSYLYTPTSAQPGGADFVAPAGYTPTVDTSYLYTPRSSQPGGADFVAPTGYSPTFNFTPASTPAQRLQQPSFVIPGTGQVIPATTAPRTIQESLDAAKDTTTTGDQAQPQGKGVLDQLLGKMSGGDIVKLLTGGLGGLMSYQAAQKAQSDAAAARAEYEAAAQKASGDVKTLAQPYLTAGGSQLSMALQGALSPAQLQQYQAQQAQLAQAAARTGGVGAIQTAAAEQAAYQQALQNQQNMALQLLGPGNQMAYNAVMTELQGTQGGLQMEMQYGMQAAQAMAGMMQSLGYGVGSIGQQKAQQ